MKIRLLVTFCYLLLSAAPLRAQTFSFKDPISTFNRNPSLTVGTIVATVTGVAAPFTVTVSIKGDQKPNDVKLTTELQTNTITKDGDLELTITLSTDTTEKRSLPYILTLQYPLADGTVKEVTHVIMLSSFQVKQVEPDAPAILHNDFLIFAGSNFDPVNQTNKLNNFSFEGLFKFDLAKHVHMRVGGFSNRNFSTDSATGIPQTRYINTTPGSSLTIGTSQIAIQTFLLDSRVTTRSVGLYGDLFYAALDNQDTRISLAGHIEYVRRTVESTVSIVNSVIRDTVLYTQTLANRNLVFGSQPISNDNIFVPRRNIDQYYLAFGMTVEKATKAFDLFVEPFVGYVVSNTQIAGRPSLYGQRYATLGIKAQATIKLLGVTLSIDLKDINTSQPYTNVSIGIPVSVKSITDKLK